MIHLNIVGDFICYEKQRDTRDRKRKKRERVRRGEREKEIMTNSDIGRERQNE